MRREGDWVCKSCADADSQAAWFAEASRLPLVLGVELPEHQPAHQGEYRLRFIPGDTGAGSWVAAKLVEQSLAWAAYPAPVGDGVAGYLERLEREHVALAQESDAMRQAFALLCRASLEWPPSFCHGDLTMENTILNEHGLYLIDPNAKPGLYRSFVLDLGKVLQSVHAFGRHPAPLFLVRALLEARGLWKQAALAEISHIIRLRKYRTPEQRLSVDRLLHKLIREVSRG